MIKIVTVRDIEGFAAKTRPKTSEKSRKIVRGIIADVRKNGDSAVRKYEKKFGSAIGSLRVSQKEIRRAYSQVSPGQLAAIRAVQKGPAGLGAGRKIKTRRPHNRDGGRENFQSPLFRL